MNPFASQASYEPPAEGRSDSSVPLQMQQPLGGAAMPAPQTKVIFFHILFRALAVVTYMNPWHTGYVLTFVLVTILSALGAQCAPACCTRAHGPTDPRLTPCHSMDYTADFWTVQKVSGRLLVGLRWVNVIDDSGKSKWEFQSYEVRSQRQRAPCNRAYSDTRLVRCCLWMRRISGLCTRRIRTRFGSHSSPSRASG